MNVFFGVLVYRNTWLKTGCKNPNPPFDWYKTQSESTVLSDMYAYCTLTNQDRATATQKSRCCGNDSNCGKGKLTCVKQTEYAGLSFF